MKTLALTIGLAITLAFISAGCATAPKSETAKAELSTKVKNTIDRFKKQDPGVAKFFDSAAGYVVFPTVGKGAVVVGGAYGRGELYEKGGTFLGYADITQATFGLALGGQSYSEIIFFEDTSALERFKASKLQLAAQASAVALESGTSANAKYADGVLVVTAGEAGLMYEASIGGQKFSYEPK